MANLYDLSAGYASLLMTYEEATTDEEREDILQLLADATDDIAEKAEAYAKVIKNVESEANAYKAEAERLTAKYTASMNLVKRLKASLLEAMKLTGANEIKTSIGKWAVALNPVSCEVLDWEMVPKRFRAPQPDKVDKKALVSEYKLTGEIIPGCEFRQEKSIRFR